MGESPSLFPGVFPLWKVAAEIQVFQTEGQQWILSCGFAFPQTSSCFPFSLRMSLVPYQGDEISHLFCCKGQNFQVSPNCASTWIPVVVWEQFIHDLGCWKLLCPIGSQHREMDKCTMGRTRNAAGMEPQMAKNTPGGICSVSVPRWIWV